MSSIRKILELGVLRGSLFDLENQGLFGFESRKVLGNTGFLSSYYFLQILINSGKLRNAHKS